MLSNAIDSSTIRQAVPKNETVVKFNPNISMFPIVLLTCTIAIVGSGSHPSRTSQLSGHQTL